jgi:hypothetical protein
VSRESCQKQLSDFFPPGDNNQPDKKKKLQQSAQLLRKICNSQPNFTVTKNLQQSAQL